MGPQGPGAKPHEFWRFENYNSKQKELLIKKGVYPYEYMDSWDSLKKSNYQARMSFIAS